MAQGFSSEDRRETVQPPAQKQRQSILGVEEPRFRSESGRPLAREVGSLLGMAAAGRVDTDILHQAAVELRRRGELVLSSVVTSYANEVVWGPKIDDPGEFSEVAVASVDWK